MNKSQNPLERTNYYSGMLLSEKDMLNEQYYMNAHRYFGNVFLHGCGIAGGLTVIKVDEELLSLEKGMAIDELGREIMVDKPRLMRLNQICGYDELIAKEDCSRAFLCMKYAEEKLTEEDICLTDEDGDNQHCKRIREGYSVYLTDKPLNDFRNTLEYFRGQDTVLYADEDIMVFQRIPNSLEAGRPFENQIVFSSNREGIKAELHLTENLSGVEYEGGEEFKADISLTVKERYKYIEYPYTLNAYNLENGIAELRVSPDHSYIVINGEKKELKPDVYIKTAVTGKDEYLELAKRYYIEYFEQQISDADRQDIYLAELRLERTDSGCRILDVRNVPFNQYVASSFLQLGLMDKAIADIRMLRKELRREESPENGQTAAVTRKPKVSSGEYIFKIPLGAKKDERLISEEIVHGLGLGPVTIDVSLVEDMKQLHGASGIFDEMEFKIDVAVLADQSKGSFRIGVRMLEVTALQELKIHWTAMMNPAEKNEDERQKRIRIIPDKLEMKTLQNYYLRAETDNLTGAVILWEVGTPNGGIVSRDGLYTAPDLPGVYEITAFCQEAPEIKDTIFVIVRE